MLSSDCVEIDVARTKDNRLVVMHRRELEQLTGRSGVQVRGEEERCRPPAGGTAMTSEADAMLGHVELAAAGREAREAARSTARSQRAAGSSARIMTWMSGCVTQRTCGVA